METSNSHLQLLMHRLEEKGMGKSKIPGFIWSMKSCVLDNPYMNLSQLNKRMKTLGWCDFSLDDRTLRLIMICFENDGIQDIKIST